MHELLTFFIKYSPLSKFRATVLCVLWALLSAGLIFSLLTLYASVTRAFGESIIQSGLSVLFSIFPVIVWLAYGVAFVYVPFVIVSFYREGGFLAVTEEGLSLPPALFGLGPHKSLRWGAVKFIDYDSSKSRLHLQTEDGSKLKVDLRKMPTQDVEQLMFAVEVLSQAANWSDPAAEFKDGLQNSKLGIETDFTQMWESELKRRYSVTTFAPHQPGTKLQNGRITILKQLAFGGFSAVYLAEDEDREKVVVKELVISSESVSEQAKAVEMFDRESRLLAGVNHPNIVHVMDHFVEGNRHYLVLEHIDGENLRQVVLRNGSFSESAVIEMGIKMASILEDLHGLNPPLLHRDFTPDNLMVTARGELTLVDFGAANECLSAVTGTLVGKQCYMPIEQIRGKAEPRSDLYALGGTLHFLLTGTDPEPLSTMTVPTASSGMSSIVERLTRMEPDQRFSSAAQVRLALSELAGSSVRAGLIATHRFEQNG